MRYLLVCLTHGTHPRQDELEATFESFLTKVKPGPAALYLHQDGDGSPHFYRGFPTPLSYAQSVPQGGFCHSTARAWKESTEYARTKRLPYIFWLEHDFVFHYDVDLAELARVLDSDRTLAQMALMRNACNPAEEKAGGLFELRPDAYTAEPEGWLSHRAYFTTNPSLMRADWMRGARFLDDGQPYCEGRYGLDLVKRGFRFGVWGDGKPWVGHFGTRTGKGY